MRKRSIWSVILAAAITVTSLPVTYLQAAPAEISAEGAENTDTSVLNLKFEEETGAASLADSSSRKGTVAVKGSVTSVQGVVGKGISLDGSTYLDLGTDGALSPEKLTLSFWMKPNADMGTGEQIITWNKQAYNSDGWYLTSNNANEPLGLSVGSHAAGGQPYYIKVSGARSEFFPAGEWTHVAVTYDSESKQAQIYRNGIPQQTSITYNVSESATGVIDACEGEQKVIGGNGPTYGYGGKLNASLDEYRLYDKVLGAADIVNAYRESGLSLDSAAVKQLEQSDLDALSIASVTAKDMILPAAGNAGSVIIWSSSDTGILSNDGKIVKYPTAEEGDKTVTLTASASYAGEEAVTKTFTVTVKALAEGQDPSLLLDLKFDEGNTSDTSIYEHPVKVKEDGTVEYPAGVKGKAVTLKGADSWLELGTSGMLCPSKMSLSFWLNPADNLTGEQIIAWHKDLYNGDGWYLRTAEGEPLGLSVGPGGGQPYFIKVEGDRNEFFPKGEWTHVVVTYDSDTKEAAVYRNGLPQKTSIGYPTGGTATGVIGPCEGVMKYIGRNGGYNTAHLSASLDEYRLYDRVFDIEEVISVYEESGRKFDKKAVAQSDLDLLSLVNSTIKDISLPLKGEKGSVITWQSSKPEVLTDKGEVKKRPGLGEQDDTVTLTASASYLNGEAAVREFTVTIKAYTEDENPNLLLDLNFDAGDLKDSSVYENLVKANGTLAYPDGIQGKAVSLNGTDSWLNLGTNGMLSPSKLSLAFWIKPNADMGTGEQVIAWSKKAFNSDGYYLTTNSKEPLGLSVGPASGGSNDQPYFIKVDGDRNEFFPVGEWTHVLVTYDSDTKEAAIYKNGIPQKTSVKYEISKTATGVIGACEGDEKSIGYNGPNYQGAYLNASLDGYRLYDMVLGLEEAIEVYEETSGRTFDKKAVAQSDIGALRIPEVITSKKIDLPLKGASSSVITWKSSDTAVISPDDGVGVVTRPEAGQPDKTVKLTATVAFAGGEAVTKEFPVTVKAIAEKNLDGILDCGIENVVLADDYLLNAAQKENDYLLSLSSKKFLYEFYRVSGLTPPVSEGYQGWERSNGTNFRGHTFGHYMSALSQAYKGAKEEQTKTALLTQIRDAVEGLKVCQDAYAAAHPESAGYVSAFRESILNKTDGTGNSDENVIVPWYNLHKVLAGLIDIYTFVDDKELAEGALEIAEGFSEYVYKRCSRLTDNTVMLRTEYGGMNEALYEIYDITGNEHYKIAAQYFDEVSLFNELAAGNDVLSGKHANTTIPKFIGALKRYTVMKDNEDYYEALSETEKTELEKYKTAAEKFWDIVIEHHTYVTGGNSQSEHFHDADKLYYDATKSAYDGSTTCETCNTYNMLKLSRELYKLTKDKKYMDYYENTYINAILSSQNPETGTTMYFQPMAPGYNKVFNRPFDEFWCCTGTGMENFSKLGDTMYFTEKSDVYVNMYFSNTFTFAEQNLKLTQTAHIPNEDKVTVKIAAVNGTEVAAGTNIKFRIPDWTAGEASILVNGVQKEITQAEKSSGYAVVSEVQAGDTIELTFPMEVKAYGTQDNEDFMAFRYGPVALSAALGTSNMDAYSANGILVRVGTMDTTCQSVITVQNMTVQEWKNNVKENLVRIADSEDGKVQFQLKNTDSPDLIYTPHFMRYKERYGLYMTFEVAGSEASQKRILEKKQMLREEEMSIETLTNFDENNSELAKNLEYESSSVGNFNGRLYRDAQKTGWFSYDLRINPQAEHNYLKCTWFSGDKGRSFDLCINGEKLQGVTINDAAGEKVFYTDTIEIPAKYWSDPQYKKDSAGEFVLDEKGEKIPVITVKLQGNGSSYVGGLFGIATTDTTKYSDNPNLSALSFDKGTLSPAFTGETKNYTLKVPKDTASVYMKVSPNTPSGLIRIGETLIDDASEQLITLTGETTNVSLTAAAQDHETTAEYTIAIVKGTGTTEAEQIQEEKNKLDAEISKAPKQEDEDKYTEESWKIYIDALAEANRVKEDPQATLQQVRDALDALKAAIDGLEKKTVQPGPGDADKNGLAAAINEANQYKDEDTYTEESWKKLCDALTEAIRVNDDAQASQTQVDQALSDLRAAIDGLEKKPTQAGPGDADKKELAAAIDEANQYTDKDKYTEDSWNKFSEALEEAVKVNNQEEATQEQVDKAAADLRAAISGLTEKNNAGNEPVKTDFTVLNKTIAAAKALKASDYTTASYNALKAALSKAEQTAKDANATQAQVNAADTALKLAINRLVKLKTVSTKALTMGLKEKYSIAGKNCTYTTSNTKIATVNKKGVIYAKKTGKATVKSIGADGKVRVYKITVKKAPTKKTKVSLNKKKVTLKAKGKKKTFQIKAKVSSKKFGSAAFKYTVDKKGKKVVKVSKTGKVTAKKKGKAVITVKTYNGKAKAVLKVTVK